MSVDDRDKWNARYAAGAYAERTRPSALLVDTLGRYPLDRGARALDVACGAGRNAVYLAQQGLSVDAVDISAVALERAATRARALGVEVRWRQADLDDSSACQGPYQLIVMVRFVNTALLRRLASRALAPGGLLVVEQHLRTDAEVAGPRSAAFRVAPGELRTALSGLQILEDWEGLTEDPDGRRVALSRIIAEC